MGARAGVGDVLGNAGREQNRFLQNNGKLVAQVGEVVVAQVRTIQQNLSRRWIIKAGEQIHQGGLARAGRAGDAQAGARLNFKRDVA